MSRISGRLDRFDTKWFGKGAQAVPGSGCAKICVLLLASKYLGHSRLHQEA